ncbi:MULTISPECIES: flavin monoamine oxidase family protein [unclassified Sporosarcina]|uniref:flavin monoamine oxidase family protein n=1 Tax=unclassified Sporosarcina TaxID=2647733 RepID=UPI0030FBEBA6
MKNPIVIIGAGLSGLRAASLLARQGVKCRLLEARDRIGGRVLSVSDTSRPELGEFDLGPTWFWPQYEQTIDDLVKELNIATFEQYAEGAMLSEQSPNETPKRYILPKNPSARSVRFKGGVQALVDAITETIPSDVIELGTRVTSIRQEKNGDVRVEAALPDETIITISARAVILALPPRIIGHHIKFTPALPSDLTTNLVNKPTWMAGHAKVVAIYERPFWRDSGLSGFVSSRVGPLQEIHDASPETGSGALFGFLGIPVEVRQQLGKEKIRELAIDQLVRLFGSEAQNVSAFLSKDWSEDSETAVEEDWIPLREFPHYGQPPEAGAWGKSIVFAGTETDPRFGGHLEGALLTAEKAVFKIVNAE